MKQKFNKEQCFFCAKPIDEEGVQWDETNNWRENPDGEGLIHINLHPLCSVRLGERLVRDGVNTDPLCVSSRALNVWLRSSINAAKGE